MRRLGRIMGAIEDGLLITLLTLMITLAGSQIIARNFFDSGFAWGDPMLRVMVLWVGLLGAMAATRDEHHISIDVISRFLKPQHRRYTATINALFTAIVCALITWHAVGFVYLEWQDGMHVFGVVPSWLAELIIPVGFGVIAIRSAITAYFELFLRDHSKTHRKGRREEPAP
ncbi:MAG: TRAP transporter small permease [Gammaproteobacteria bacterium]|nr:TRAP transporter small permease [Gammaproteobacteria bacterium]